MVWARLRSKLSDYRRKQQYASSLRRFRRSWPSPLRGFQDLLDALLTGGVPVEARLLLLAPLLQLRLHVRARLLVLGVPVLEGLLRLLLGLEDAEEVLRAEDVDGLGLVEHVRGAPVVPELALDDGR